MEEEIYSCYYCGEKDKESNLNIIFGGKLEGKFSACDGCLPKHNKINEICMCIRVEKYTRCEKCKSKEIRATFEYSLDENDNSEFKCICLDCGHEFRTKYK